MVTRRSVLAGASASLLVGAAGCIGELTGDEPISASAQKAIAGEAALDETGYSEYESGWTEKSDTVSVADVERDVEIDLWYAAYSKELEIQDTEMEAGVLGVLSTPNEEVGGESLNELADADPEDVLERLKEENGLSDEYDQLEDIEKEGERQLPILGEDRQVGVFAGTTEHEGTEYDVRLYVAVFKHEGDVLVLAGGHPELVEDEGPNVETLLSSVEHPVEE